MYCAEGESGFVRQRSGRDMERYHRSFDRDTHFVAFESPDEMLEQVQYLLDHPAERIAMAGLKPIVTSKPGTAPPVDKKGLFSKLMPWKR